MTNKNRAMVTGAGAGAAAGALVVYGMAAVGLAMTGAESAAIAAGFAALVAVIARRFA